MTRRSERENVLAPDGAGGLGQRQEVTGAIAHTPGPWGIREENHRLWVAPIRKSDGVVLSFPRLAEYRESKSGAARGCSPRWHGFTAEDYANAVLIAKAPDLLKALTNAAHALDYCLTHYVPNDDVLARKCAKNLETAQALIANCPAPSSPSLPAERSGATPDSSTAHRAGIQGKGE